MIDVPRGPRPTDHEVQALKAAVARMLEAAVKATGQRQAVMRPLVCNVPQPPCDGWELTPCPQCGRDCWKTDLEPDELPAHCFACCSECALRAMAVAQREARD